MSYPELAQAVAAVLDGIPPGELRVASERLRERYRTGSSVGVTASDAEALAYLATRLPATAEAMRQALVAVAKLLPSLEPSSQLDIGAGAGAAAWAARSVWPSLEQVTLLETDPRTLRLGERLAAGVEGRHRAAWTWRLSDVTGGDLPAADVVTAGYVFGELDADNVLAVAEAAWRAARKLFVLVGPGTPAGFEQIRTVRDQLARTGVTIVAPCPHQHPCPIEAPDWCHFAARVERSPLHRSLKNGRLGYEDEKFSYAAFARHERPPAVAGRVLRHPTARRRLVELELCCDDGRIHSERIGQSKDAYRQARSLRWGDTVGEEIAGAGGRRSGDPAGPPPAPHPG